MDVDQRIAELTQKMLRRKFYAVLSQPSSTPEKLKPLLPAHLEYMIGAGKARRSVRLRAAAATAPGRRAAPG